jgi:hypothetical protein
MGNTLENLPTDIAGLSNDVLKQLRSTRMGGAYEVLTSKQQRLYNELGEACLRHLVSSPDSALLLEKRGPSEEAYGINIVKISGAILRAHFYTHAGVRAVDTCIGSDGIVDVETFGTPHNHTGNISAVVPRGRLVHYDFREQPGSDYTAGYVEYEERAGPGRERTSTHSIFVPSRPASLDHSSAVDFDASNGYWMNKKTIHVVSWPEPTVTVFFNDLTDRHQCTIYQQPGLQDPIERPRALDPIERQAAWEAFVELVQQGQ